MIVATATATATAAATARANDTARASRTACRIEARRWIPAWVRAMGLLLLVLVLVLVAGCAQPPPAPPPVAPGEAPLAYALAVQALSADLSAQVRSDADRAEPGVAAMLNRLKGPPPARQVVVDPFIDAQNGYGTQMTQRLQDDLSRALLAASPGMRFAPLTAGNLAASTYVMTGSLSFEPIAQGSNERRYRALISLVDARSARVVANSTVWLAERNLDMTPLAAFQDSPVFLNDRYARGLVATARARPGASADAVYFNQLSTAALLADAQEAFARDEFREALGLYQRAESRPDGRSMKTYSGIYVSHLKLNNLPDAERAFGQLVSVALEEGNLSIRFLFRVNSTDFIADPRLSEQYRLWVRQLSQQVVRNRVCLEVLGHSSRSGSEQYNDQLSLARAEALRRQMQADGPGAMQLTRAVGRGTRDNLVGSGTDDARDAVDRRVEFRLIPCSVLRS